MATIFQEIFESILDIHAPLRRKRVRSEFAPWLTLSLKRSILERDKLKVQAENSPEIWSVYKRKRNQVTKMIRISIRDYYNGLIEENIRDPKKMWRTINTVLDKNVETVSHSSLEVEGKYLTRERDVVEAMNRHFALVGPKLAEKITSKPDDDCLCYITPKSNVMTFKTINETYMHNAIKNLKNGKAAGPDKIPITIIKDVGDIITKPLTMIFNSSLTNGVFPDIWKIARITPIFKSGAKNDVNNYRPISVISVFSRILERIVHDQLYEFLKANKIITSNQSAFQNLYSTVTSLICSTDYWYENIDHKKLNLTIFLDLKKAFDTVDHRIMVEKLTSYGIRGIPGNWFKSYLHNRQQYCSLNGKKSKNREVTCGIPQGSCLGPLLFILYLNDFERCLKYSKANIYADDTNITIASNDKEKLVADAQAELHNITEWMRVNKLSPNPSKTEYMIIGHPMKAKGANAPTGLELDRKEIKRVSNTKSLGVMVDEYLNWDEQFKSVKSKICGGLASLKKLKNILPQSKLCCVYYAIVESHLRYADVIWGSLPVRKIETLQRLQNRAHLIIKTARVKDNWSCNWLNISNLISFDRLVMTYKIINRLSPESLWDKFELRSVHSKYETRNCHDLQIPRLNMERAKNGFKYSALKLWNDIPADIREVSTLKCFKKKLKAHLLADKK